ncbi:activating transcription factor 7-interacting protein 1 isoform X1 [Ovis aries]|uniref:Activating transcription factor 7 interacting protein n=1 Tax=Ovis aries TaxID=9940 RepID=A0AC11ARP5_SHEEP|nr:activating transcription factor 7-interacting protein 1 isoform X1 [Ovis aries]XP_042103439.1 activating transcription factor 7-interacting protein 1 isoform X1 [Ovis aries]XP_042103440.1 activating transcription factor 7-interacting protein 1 isoform X1 [Ovis aries]XP_042103441.1 activating transcription factor 7-interacting protein 1 isoform X1 [Ovis aries]XP_060269364.1 activating transcription factor 7-interacting protein 1 isoform X1 [Ovis aries]XP_060269365.1 activating transcription 
MDSIEEPQKKVFKARKTMRVSDRQQLEAVYKVKEELLKTDVKLLNGNHENGDLDPTSPLENMDYLNDKEEVNGIEDLCFDPEKSKAEWKETPCTLNVHVKSKQDDDLKCEPLSANNVSPDLASKLTAEPSSGDPASDLATGGLGSGDSVSGDLASETLTSGDPASGDPISGDLASGETVSSELVSSEPVSNELVSSEPVPGESVSTEPVSNDSACDDLASHDLASESLASDDPGSGDLTSSDPAFGDSASGNPASDEPTSETAFDPTFDPSSVPACEPVPETDSTEPNSNNGDDFLQQNRDNEKLDQVFSFDEKNKADSNSDADAEALETDDTIICSDLSPEKKLEEDTITESALGEEAISSSVEIDHSEKNEEENSADLIETISEDVIKDDKNENILENTDSMETDEIIPILEKLAPAEDELTCFSKASLLPIDESNPDLEEKMEGSFGSPSKQESSESLPKEAFLVLSDEEDISGEKDESEVISQNETCSPEQIESNEKDSKPEEEEQVIREDERPSEKSEFFRRKRSKSEDMDNIQSKRRRYLEEEYEAEFQVKITAKGDINQKLQKVVQWLLEEKLCALQCAVFDKTLAELKTRVEKIECNKRHKTVLAELQAKIARLTKRFGAAKEDLKKRQENPPNPPVSPGKSVVDVISNNSVPYRNTNTVRQMLESKRNISESAPPSFQTPVNTVSSTNLVTPPTVVSSQPKLQPPVTSGSLTATSVLPAPNTATVVASTQVPSGNPQPTISLQSLPVILHVPVAVSSQPQLLQSHPGTLVTNQPSGNVEFISVQSPPTVSGLTKNPVSLPSLPNPKPNNVPSVPSPSIQRNSPASAAPLGTTLAVQAVPTAHSIVQATRTSLPTVGPSGLYSPSNNRGPIQMKIPISAFSTSSPAEQSSTTTTRIENQTNKTVDASVNKKAADSTSQSGKATSSDSGGVIDLTMDDEESGALQDPKKVNHTPVSTMSSSQPLSRPLQPIQPAPPLQPSGVPTSGPSQTTIHLLPTAPTTVNVTHRPVTQVTTRLPVPRAPANHQVVYTTLPAPPAQAPLRGTVMQAPAVRQVNPQNRELTRKKWTGVTVRVPQATTYVVNNGLTLGSTGPQLTVHHRPPQVHTEPPRPVHPAPLPEAPQPQRLPPEAASTSLPQKPHLKLARVQSQNGIVLSWSVLEVDRSCATVDSYHLYAYHEEPSATVPSQWKKIGEVKALPLPMACTLTQFVSGSKYYFAVRAKDIYGRFGPFCDPQSTDVISSSQSS